MSWSLPTSVRVNVPALAFLMLDRSNFFIRMSIWLSYFIPGLCMSTVWIAYGCLGHLPIQDCFRFQSQGVWAFCHCSPDCRKVHKHFPNLLVHLLLFLHSSLLVQPECPAVVFDQLEMSTGVHCRTHQFHCRHGWILVTGITMHQLRLNKLTY